MVAATRDADELKVFSWDIQDAWAKRSTAQAGPTGVSKGWIGVTAL